MKAFLMAYDLWDIVDQGYEPATEIAGLLTDEEEALLKQKQQKSVRALTFIHSAVADSIFPRIVGAVTSKQAWDILQDEFQGSEKVRMAKLNTLRREFENLLMKESEMVKDFFARMIEVVNQMRLYGEDIPDRRIVEKLLVTLPKRFDAKVAALEESWDLNSLSVTEFLGSLQAYEQRIMSRNENSGEAAFQARHKKKFPFKTSKGQTSGQNQMEENRKFSFERNTDKKGKFPPCGICRRTNHLEKFCWKNKTCSFCNKQGHVEKVCRFKSESQSQQQQKRPQQHQSHATQANRQHVNFSSSATKEEHLFMALHSSDNNKNGETWYLDSGCTSHMCNNSALFTSFNSFDKPPVKMGDDTYVQASGRGTIAVETKKGIRYIDNVLLVPKLGQNLLSVAQMLKSKYILHFEGSDCSISDPNGIEIARVAVENDSFPLKLKPAFDHAFISAVDKTWLWHRRYGHYNLRSLLFLQSNDLVRDMSHIQVSNEVCECCQLGKAHRQPFTSGSVRRAKERLELIHSDVCGPMRTPSLSQNKYFILFIDDLTRMTWVYFLTNKSQVYSVFRKFKQMVEVQSGCTIKTLRTDNGKEYTSNEFNQFCDDMGIKHQLTVPYTPEQNGVCERKNRTVLEMARCMLIEKGMPKEFWAEAVYTATYLLNRLPTKHLIMLHP